MILPEKFDLVVKLFFLGAKILAMKIKVQKETIQNLTIGLQEEVDLEIGHDRHEVEKHRAKLQK